MRLYLIRHGETVDNLAQVYAGVKDSALSVHGSLQAGRLGRFLCDTEAWPTQIYSSDLQRAYMTADAIRLAQRQSDKSESHPLEVVRLPILREQDFGSYEGRPYSSRKHGSVDLSKDSRLVQRTKWPDFKDFESKEAMARRMNSFLDDYVLRVLQNNGSRVEPVMFIVSHGIILSTLWKCLLVRFTRHNVRLGQGTTVMGGAASLEHIGGWSNTGYLMLDIQELRERDAKLIGLGEQRTSGNSKATLNNECRPHLLDSFCMVIRAINSKEHLQGLKRTGGGVGSSKFDGGQKTIESFFKRRKV